MKFALRLFPVAVACVLLLPGCKKNEPEVAGEGDPTAPKEEQLPTPSAAPGAPAETAPVAQEEMKSNADFEVWFKKYNLDLNDPKMLDADQDGDGFSNRDEFLADTNPLDPESRPGIHKSMRLKEYTEVRLPFVLRSVQGETATVEFPAPGAPEGTAAVGKEEKIHKGETIRGTKLKVERVEVRMDTDKNGEKVDMTQVVLTDTETNDKVVALKDLPTRTSASFATLVSTDGQTALKVREGESFSWPAEPGVTYKVIDLRADQVVIKDETSGKTITVPKL